MTNREITDRLSALRDIQYREFQCRLMPTVAPERVIGVRTPQVRQLAKELSGSAAATDFLNTLPHFYYEENNLHGFLIERLNDFGEAAAHMEAFFPYIDNWATCDSTSPKVFARNLPALYEKIKLWTSSSDIYAVRFALNMLMNHFLGDAFSPDVPQLAAAVHSEEYYINMMRAWFFATALAKQYEAILPYITEHRLDIWTHNKAIQKALESRRIDADKKAYLKTLKIKN